MKDNMILKIVLVVVFLLGVFFTGLNAYQAQSLNSRIITFKEQLMNSKTDQEASMVLSDFLAYTDDSTAALSADAFKLGTQNSTYTISIIQGKDGCNGSNAGTAICRSNFEDNVGGGGGGGGSSQSAKSEVKNSNSNTNKADTSKKNQSNQNKKLPVCRSEEEYQNRYDEQTNPNGTCRDRAGTCSLGFGVDSKCITRYQKSGWVGRTTNVGSIIGGFFGPVGSFASRIVPLNWQTGGGTSNDPAPVRANNNGPSNANTNTNSNRTVNNANSSR